MSTRPRISFNQEGVLMLAFGQTKKQINWDKRNKEFLKLVKKLEKIKNQNLM